MKKKEDVLEELNNILDEYEIAVYTLSKMTNINNSTLQKGLKGERNLSLRNIKTILDVLPIGIEQRERIYDRFVGFIWGKNKVNISKTIDGIFEKINKYCEEDAKKWQLGGGSLDANVINYNISKLIMEYLSNEDIKEKSIYMYVPFFDDIIANSINCCLEQSDVRPKISVLFEMFKAKEDAKATNLIIFKNILDLVLDRYGCCELYYNYVKEINKSEFLVYPYYIVFEDKVVMLNIKLDNMAIVNDKSIIEYYKKMHNENVVKAKRIKKASYSIENVVNTFNNSPIEDCDISSIAYEPCISAFVNYDIYKDLIMDTYPFKNETLKITKKRLSQLNEIPKKRCCFNVNAIEKFVEFGNILPFKHPYLKNCTLEQRKQVLTNILNALETPNVIMRAFKDDDINISSKFEISEIDKHFHFYIMIYLENEVISINITEPIISNHFNQYLLDMMETSNMFTEEETKQLFINAINKLDKMIEEKNSK